MTAVARLSSEIGATCVMTNRARLRDAVSSYRTQLGLSNSLMNIFISLFIVLWNSHRAGRQERCHESFHHAGTR